MHFIIGDFTARIGDSSGHNITRPMLSEEQVISNIVSYKSQIFRILDKNFTIMVIAGLIFYKNNNIEDCYKQQKILSEEDKQISTNLSSHHHPVMQVTFHRNQILYLLVQLFQYVSIYYILLF